MFRSLQAGKHYIYILGILIIGIWAISFWGNKTQQSSEQPNRETIQHSASAKVPSKPFVFLENKGQWHEKAKYYAASGNMSAWFERDAITLSLARKTENERAGVVTRLNFTNASTETHINGENPLSVKHNYLRGKNSSNWQRNVLSYEQIVYNQLYEDIDLRVRDNDGVLEYDLLLQPGADLEQVVVACEGIQSLSLDEDGSLLIETGLGPLRQKQPTTWHELPDGEKLPVLCEYRLLNDTIFGFVVEELQPELALVVDPGLEWSTFVGGSGFEYPGDNGLTIADNGDILLCGLTSSPNFPTTTGVFDTSLANDFDVFVSRWNPDLVGQDQLIWSTFLGGAGNDEGHTILHEDISGNIIIAGQTGSLDFPITNSAYDTTYNGGDLDGFVLKLDATGSELLYSTYLGGTGDDVFWDIEFDLSGLPTFTGGTTSSDFPVTATAFDTTFNGELDIFVTRLNLENDKADQLIWSTYFGGSSTEEVYSIGMDAAGVVTISGEVLSPDLPTTIGAFDSEFSGGPDFFPADCFIAQFEPDKVGAASLKNATYLGGSSFDFGGYSAVHPNGLVTVAGASASEDFPLTADAYSKRTSAYESIYISRFNFEATGQDQLLYSTFVSGNLFEIPLAMAIDDSAKVYVAGQTRSSGFPTTPNAVDNTHNGLSDAIIFCLNPNAKDTAQLEYSTFLGSTPTEFAHVIALKKEGNIVVGGRTGRFNSFPTTAGAFQKVFGGGLDAFLAIIEPGGTIPTAGEFLVSLGGSQQVPAVSTESSGKGTLSLYADSTRLSYDISLLLSSDVTGVSFHEAPYGVNGQAVKTIYTGHELGSFISFTGEWTRSDDEPLTSNLVKKLFAEEIYVSVQTDSFPNGDIRGQILPTTLESIARAEPGIFYAVLENGAGDFAGSLIQIDQITGAGNVIGQTYVNFFGALRIASLAVSSLGEIFTLAPSGSSELWRVDALTGSGTWVGIPGINFAFTMAFDMTDRLFSISSSDENLFELNPNTGAATWLGRVDKAIGGMAFDPTDNTLWASTSREADPFDEIYTIDIGTGEATLVGNTGFNSPIEGIIFDRKGNLYGISGGGDRQNDLIIINKETGAGTVIGQVGFTAVAGLGTRMPTPDGAQISIDARAINVGTSEQGESKSRTISITNYGSSDLIVSEIADPGAPFLFSELPDLPVTIQPRDRETFRVTFQPDIEGKYETVIVITSNDSSDLVLERRLFANAENVTSVAESKKNIPQQFALAQNFPNPFNPSTTIRYDLPESAEVKLEIYDILGRKVLTLVNTRQAPGSKEVIWNGRDDSGLPVATGIYFYRIKAGKFMQTKKLMLIK